MKINSQILILVGLLSSGSVAANPLKKSDSIHHALKVQKAMREIYQEVNPAEVRIETEETIDIKETKGRLVDLIQRGSYKEISYKTEKGKIVSVKRKTKHK